MSTGYDYSMLQKCNFHTKDTVKTVSFANTDILKKCSFCNHLAFCLEQKPLVFEHLTCYQNMNPKFFGFQNEIDARQISS